MKNKDLNFALKIVIFTSALLIGYFYIDKLNIVVMLPLALCLYDEFIILSKIKDKETAKAFNIIITVLALIFSAHTIVRYGINNPTPMILIFIMTNLFFIYNIIIYICYKYKKINLVLLIVSWIICDSVPILIFTLLSSFL